MELTGKCKQDFEKWFFYSVNQNGLSKEQIKKDIEYRKKLFYSMPFQCQIGVYENFADNVNIDISVKPVYVEKKKEFYAEVDTVYFFYAKTRDEAREWAVKQLEEIYNDKIQWL